MSDKNKNYDILRFATIGNVDDGKSTLIGRLLYDLGEVYDDQYEAIKKSSEESGSDYVNLALLTDGLKAEREQGITIDVAYRYFATDKRKFIIADCPGHVQYTRNMITGASQVNAVVLLIDARHGMTEQTKRHILLSSLMQVKHLVLCINKMDLVEFSQERYDEICNDCNNFLSKLQIPDIRYIPISALDGDNVVNRSDKMSWYEGTTFLYAIENMNVSNDSNFITPRFPVQRVIRPFCDEYHDYRGYAGMVESGVFRKGEDVTILPSGFKSKISKIDTPKGEVDEAFYPMCVNILLEDEYDISRGDMLAKPNNMPNVSQDIELILIWMNETALQPRKKYIIKHNTREVNVLVKDIRYKLDVNTLHRQEEDKNIGLNDIARVHVRTSSPLFYDEYSHNKNNGYVIFIDEFTNETVGAGLIVIKNQH